MSNKCCPCDPASASGGKAVNGLPLICLVPRDSAGAGGAGGGASKPRSAPTESTMESDFQFLDAEYIAKHFNLPQRALYLDPFRRPLITFPLTGDKSKNFNMARKNKVNQMILDGLLDPSEAITAPSVFPYAKTEAEKRKEAEDDEEIIYILQLPDWEYQCPVHNQTIRTPRFIWHSCKKKETSSGEMKQGGGPLNRPKPWILSRITDFDMQSQCPLARPGFDALGMTAPVMVQVNPNGEWKSSPPKDVDEEQLKKIVDYLIKTKAISAAQSYCSQCCAENQKSGGEKPNSFVPVILMPILPADQCPFDMDCEVQKKKDDETKQSKQTKKVLAEGDDKDKAHTKQKKRGFVMQRLTDFDLMSQW